MDPSALSVFFPHCPRQRGRAYAQKTLARSDTKKPPDQRGLYLQPGRVELRAGHQRAEPATAGHARLGAGLFFAVAPQQSRWCFTQRG